MNEKANPFILCPKALQQRIVVVLVDDFRLFLADGGGEFFQGGFLDAGDALEAAYEVLRLSHINHRPFLVEETVNPRGMRQIFDFFADFHCHKFRNFCSEWGVPANSETISPTYGEIN